MEAASKANVDTPLVLKNVPKLAKALKDQGYKTEKDLDEFIQEFPGFKENTEVLNALRLEMQDVNIQEPSIAVTETPRTQADAVYDKLFPGCKK